MPDQLHSPIDRQAMTPGSDDAHPFRTTAKIVGLLFLIATVSFAVGDGIQKSIVDAPDSLQNVYQNRTGMEIGALLTFVAAVANVTIGVLLFPVLRRHSERIALGYLVTRIVDGAGVLVSGIVGLTLVALSHQTVPQGSSSAASSLALVESLVSVNETTYFVTMALLGIGAMPFCYLLYRSRLIPRPLSILGMVGYAALFVGSTAEILGVNLYLIHYIPGGLFELILPIQLIFRGFNQPAIATDPETTAVAGGQVPTPAAQGGSIA